MSIARITEISATSTKGFEDAIRQGVSRASTTLRNVRSAWVKEQQVRIENGNITEFQVNLMVTFVLDDDQADKYLMADAVLGAAGLSADEVDWVVPHQANARILDATAKKLGLPPEKVVVTVDRHANTSAASVPLAFDTAVKDGRIKRGDIVVLEAMGGGFTWGAAALRY